MFEIVASEYTKEDAEECMYVLQQAYPTHEFRMERTTFCMFGETFPVVGILDVTAEEVTILN